MFLAPKQAVVDTSGGSFSSMRVDPFTGQYRKIDPKTTIGPAAEIQKILPIEADSFLGGFKQGLNGSLKATLVNPVLTTNGRDKLATVDPYKKVIETPQNRLASVLSNHFGTPGVVLGGIIRNEPLRKMTSELIRTGKVDSDSSKAFIKSFNNNLLAGVSTYTAPFIDELQKEIGMDGIDGKQLMSSLLGVDGAPRIEKVLSQNPTIGMIIKGKEYLAKADFSSTDGIFKVLDNLTANTQLSSMFDLKTEFALMNILTKGLMAFDAPDLFSRVGEWFRKDVMGDDNGESYNQEMLYYLDNLDNAIDESSLTFLECLLKRVTPDKVLDSNRNFVTDFLANFKLRYDQEPTAAMGIRLNELMTIIDPKWAKTQLVPGSGDWVSDLRPFKNMSNEACRVLMLADLYQVELTIANYYPIKPVREYMKSLYPFAPIQ